MADASQEETQDHKWTTQSSNQVGTPIDRSEYESKLTLSQELDSQKLLNAPATSVDLDACNQHNAFASFPERTSKCKTCQNILRCFSQLDLAKPVNLGSITEALATQCRTHKPLVQAFVDHLRSCLERDNFSREEHGDIGIHPGFLKSRVYFTESISKRGVFLSQLLVRKGFVPHHPGIGRILNPDWVNVDMLNQWKKQCL